MVREWRRTLAIAWIAARNAVPVAGLIFLGWKAEHLVILYYIDTLVSISAVLTLFFIHATDRPPGHSYTAKELLGLTIVNVFLTAAIGFAVAFPAIVTLGLADEGFGIFLDREFLWGLGLQTAAAAASFITTHFEIRGRADRELRLKSRFAFALMRWVVVFAASLVLPFAVVLVVAYAAASIYFELRPPPPE